MSRRCVASFIVAVAVLGAASTAAASSVWFQGAIVTRHHVRPSTLWLSADGTLLVSQAHWSRWGGRVAVGKGEAEYHGCRPYCGTAPVHRAAVTVHLWGIRDCGGQLYYNKVTLYTRHGKIRVRYQHWAPC